MSLFRDLIRFIGRRVRKPLRKLGYDVVAVGSMPTPDARAFWVERLGIDLVLDVGANEGQFVGWIRDRGYKGPVLSFEPQKSAFDVCSAKLAGDRMWHGLHAALGEKEGRFDIHVAGNSMSSSLLPMLDSHVQALPESAIIATESVSVMRLDSVNHSAIAQSARIFLKIDTQGYELPVLLGATGLMDKVAFLEAELSLTPLYDGQVLMPKMLEEIDRMGFTLVWLDPGFSDSANARLLQVDGLFVKKNLLADA
ncbi:MAG: FkbM family methyltransferase [Beijerinckiaceae bacterium]